MEKSGQSPSLLERCRVLWGKQLVLRGEYHASSASQKEKEPSVPLE